MADLKKYLTNPSLIFEGFFRQASSYSVFQNKSEFNVKVLTSPQPYFSIEDSSGESVEKYSFKGRILDPNMAHEKFLDDPCDNTIASDKAYAEALISLHATVIADENPECGVGSIIRAFIEPGDNNNIYNLQHMKYIGTVTKSTAPTDIEQECLVLSSYDFSDADSLQVMPQQVAQTGAEFIELMIESEYFPQEDFSVQFLAGLAGNALNESNFDASAAGDPRTAPSSEGPYIPINARGGYKCSFGLWQLNVCGENFGGGRFIKHFQLQNEEPEEILAAITDINKQFEFVSKDLKDIFDERERKTDDPEDAARIIAVRFEVCSECKDYEGDATSENAQTRGRMANAKRFYDQYESYRTVPTSSISEVSLETPDA